MGLEEVVAVRPEFFIVGLDGVVHVRHGLYEGRQRFLHISLRTVVSRDSQRAEDVGRSVWTPESTMAGSAAC
jgi:hypothetical protein